MSNDIIPAEFLGTPLSIIERNGLKWLTAEQVGRCLGYATTNARKGINQIYNSHADEFGPTDTFVAELTTNPQGGNPNARLFSGTGCHLLGMFAQTPRAKDFRAWAKRVLMNTAQPAAPELAGELARIEAERDALRQALLAQNPQFRAIIRYHAIKGLTQLEKAKLMGWTSCESWRRALIKLAELKLIDYRPDPRAGAKLLVARQAAQRVAKGAEHV